MTSYTFPPYQKKANHWLLSRRDAGLFLDPGLGKTIVSLDAFIKLQNAGSVRAALVVAPLRVCLATWPQEIAKWAQTRHLRCEILHGSGKAAALGREADIYLINPEGLEWLFNTALKGRREYPFDLLIIDESSKFKNYSSKRHKLLRAKLPATGGKFKRTWILTGSPAPNGLLDTYGQYWLIDRGQSAGTFSQFRERYFYRTGWMDKEWAIRPGSEAAIHALLADRCLSMQADDYLDLPPLIIRDRLIDLPAKARKIYDTMEAELFAEIAGGGEFIALNSSSAAGKCQQIANGALYHDITELERLGGKIHGSAFPVT